MHILFLGEPRSYFAIEYVSTFTLNLIRALQAYYWSD